MIIDPIHLALFLFLSLSLGALIGVICMAVLAINRPGSDDAS